MRQFVRVTPVDQDPMLIPVDRIHVIESNDTPGCRIAYQGEYVHASAVHVMQSIDDMQRKLNGEQL